MSELTLERLRQAMRKSLGGGEASLDGDVLDEPFTDLGFDSLAVLDILAQIQQAHGLRVPDDATAEMTTPRILLDYVNLLLAET
jgi:act minimal PKS acyl carrier protein